jgi:hypothetical protein
MVGLGLIVTIGLMALVWLWVDGIDYMKKNHPDYKGEDFFNEEDKTEIS